MSGQNQSETRVTFLGCFVWFLAVLFFFYEFSLRVIPGTIAKPIYDTLKISIEQFSLIGSAYYIIYSIMQIPVGIILDRFSAKLWVIIAVAACAIGAFLFSIAGGFFSAFIARFLIGFGSSFGFIFLMIVSLTWFPRKYFAFLIGCGQFLGAMGPLCAGAPIAIWMEKTGGDWRLIFTYAAIFGIALALAITLFFVNKPKSEEKILFISRKESLKKQLGNLLSRPQVWFTLIFTATAYVAIPLIGAFWGSTYLQTRGFKPSAAAFIASMMWVGLGVGSPLFGRFSDLMKRRKPLMIFCSLIGAISSATFLWTTTMNPLFLSILFFLVGIGASGYGIGYAVITEQSPKSLQGTALGLNNTAVMGFAAIIPPIVTTIIHRYSNGTHLTEAAFERGLLIIPISFSLALLVVIFTIKETFCRHQLEVHHISSDE